MDHFLANFLAAVAMFMLLVLAFAIRLFMMRRAMFQVIEILRSRHSRCTEDPKTLDELGLRPPDFFTRLIGRKDYKPYALQALIQIDAVRITDDEKVCLVEGNLTKGLV